MTSGHRVLFVGVDEGTEEARGVKPSCDSVSKLRSSCCAHVHKNLHYDMSVQWLHSHLHSGG